MRRNLFLTEDGSHSIRVPELNISYHSIYGAITESQHVFIETGLKSLEREDPAKPVEIFEVGLGTGLNALLTLEQSEKIKQRINYESIEPSPLQMDEVKSLNYCEVLNRRDLQGSFERIHSCDWSVEIEITPNFYLFKTKQDLENYIHSGFKDLIYFDAFDPGVQPELWSEKIFVKMNSMLNPGGILVTYSSKGSVRRVLQSAGFLVKKLPGPPGKREIIKAVKPLMV